MDNFEVILNNRGFTLIEVIVSMILVSMITLIMAFALNVNLQAWERGVNEGDKVQIEVVLPNMMERQLRAIVSSASLSNNDDSLSTENSKTKTTSVDSKTSLTGANALLQTGNNMTQLQFSGKEQSLSFYTLYSPQGTPSQGLIRVTYLYDEDAKELTVYEKVISNEDDTKDSDGLTSNKSKKSKQQSFSSFRKSGKKSGGKFSGQTVPVATITDVEKFSLSFLAGEEKGFLEGDSLSSSFDGASTSSGLSSSRGSSDFKMDGASFKDSWDENSQNPPGFIRLLFAQTKRRGGVPSLWLFKVGGTI